MALGASNATIATAAIGLVPVIQGVRGNIASQLASSSVMSSADSAGRNIGSRMAGSAMNALKGGLKIASVLGGVVGAVTIKGGLTRALGIEDAQAMLTGLGHDTKAVEGIMNNALKSVEGTAFGLDAAATTAAGSVAAGIVPGEQLEQTLTTVANVAAGAKAPMEEIGSIFNTVAAVGAAYTGDINMIAQRGIPIWQSLSKQLGVSQEDVKKMATEGKIDFATFELAARDAAGGVAGAMGQTTRGTFQNMMAGVNRLGATFVTGLLPLAKTTFVGITGLIDAVNAKIKPFITAFFERFGGGAEAGIQGFFDGLIQRVESFDPTPIILFFREVTGGIQAFGAAWQANDGDITSSGFPGFMERVANIARPIFDELKGGITAFGAAWKYNDGEITSSGLPGFMEAAAYAIRQVWDALKGADYSSFGSFIDSIAGADIGGAFSGIGGGLGDIAKASPGVLSFLLQSVGRAMQFIGDHSDTIVKLLPYLVAGFAAYKLATQGLTAATTAQRSVDLATLPVQIARNISSYAAAKARLAATLAEIGQTRATKSTRLATIQATIAEKTRTIVTKAGTIATNLATKAMNFAKLAAKGLWKALMGPIGWIIAGLALVTAGLVWFFTQTEVGQELWAKIWGWIKNAAAAVVDWFMDTAVPYLKAAWDGIAAGALWLYNNAILPAWNGIRRAIGVVGDWITGTLWPAMKAAWDGIANAALWLYNNVIQPVWKGIRIAIAVAVTAVLTYIDLLKWWFTGVIAPVAMWLWNKVLKPAWEGIRIAIAVAVTAVLVYIDLLKWYFSNVIAPVALWLYNKIILPAWNGIRSAISAVISWVVNTGWPLLKKAWDAIAAAAVWLWQKVLQPAWNGIRTAISAVVGWIVNTAWPAIKVAWDALASAARWLWNNVMVPVWNGIKTAIGAVVGWFQNTAWPILQQVIALVQMRFQQFRQNLAIIWAYIQAKVIQPVIAWFRDTAWPMISGVIDKVKLGFYTMKDALKKAWEFVKDKVINPVATWFRDTVAPLFDTATGKVKDAFNGLRDAIKTAWEKIRDTAKKPIEFVVNKVINDAIIGNFNSVAGTFGLDKVKDVKLPAGWRKGGILPGYTPMRRGDDVLTPMRSGEGVLVSEGLRDAASRSLFLGANEAAKRGVSFSEFMGGGYAGGGIVGRLKDGAQEFAGDAVDAIGKGWDFASAVLTDPAGALKKAVEAFTASIPGAGKIRDLAVEYPLKLAKDIGTKLLGSFSSDDGGSVPSVGKATRGGGSLSVAASLARGLGLTMTSGYRPGARTAGSGSLSLHGQNRARDYAGSPAKMMSLFNALHPYAPTELLYSPAGGRQWRRGGFQANTSGATKRMHYNHVHVGFADGGIVPTLYDQGGKLPPGVRVVANKHSRPETILPPDESAALTRIAQNGSGGGQHFHYSPTQVDVSEEVERRTRREFETMVHAARKVVRV